MQDRFGLRHARRGQPQHRRISVRREVCEIGRGRQIFLHEQIIICDTRAEPSGERACSIGVPPAIRKRRSFVTSTRLAPRPAEPCRGFTNSGPCPDQIRSERSTACPHKRRACSIGTASPCPLRNSAAACLSARNWRLRRIAQQGQQPVHGPAGKRMEAGKDAAPDESFVRLRTAPDGMKGHARCFANRQGFLPRDFHGTRGAPSPARQGAPARWRRDGRPPARAARNALPPSAAARASADRPGSRSPAHQWAGSCAAW